MEQWDENVRIGYIISLIFCSLVVTIFCCAPNIYLIIRHFKDNEPLKRPDVDWAYQAYNDYNDFRTTQNTQSHVSDELHSADTHDKGHVKLTQRDSSGLKVSKLEAFHNRSVSERLGNIEPILFQSSDGDGDDKQSSTSIAGVSVANSLYETRVTYKFKFRDTVNA